MRGIFCLLVVVVVCVGGACAQRLPTLHLIQKYLFAAPYSCKGSYELSALFVSSYSLGRNSPDLLYNGACGSSLYFEAATAGDDFALLSNLGKLPLVNVSASKTFYDTNYNSFTETVGVVEGNTYAVLISKSEIRALFAFAVTKLNGDNSLEIEYAVLSYSIQNTASASPGWSWDEGNHYM